MKYCRSCSNECLETLRICPKCGHAEFSTERSNNDDHGDGGLRVTPIDVNSSDQQTVGGTTPKLYGVKGWLKFFVILFVFVWPLMGVASFLYVLDLLNMFPESEKTYFIFSLCVGACMNIGFIYCGVLIWKIRTGAISFTKKLLWFCFAYYVLDLFLYSMIVEPSAQGVGMVFWTLIFLGYFSTSKRVKNTFPQQ